MNTLVVYDSQYGNTERIAQAIADTLRGFGQAQAVRVDPARMGSAHLGGCWHFHGWLRSGGSSECRQQSG